MSDLKMMATTLWTSLLEGLRADGLIANCVTQSGPATTAVIVDTVQQLAQAESPWLNEATKPQPGRDVVAMTECGKMVAVQWHAELGWLYSHDGYGCGFVIARWRFVS